MSFEDTLAVLQGWLGRELEVALLSSVGEGVIATMAGELVAGSDLSGAGERDGALYFQLAGVGASGFFLGPGRFALPSGTTRSGRCWRWMSGACGC